VQLIRLAPPASQAAADLRAGLITLGNGSEVVGGVGLLGLRLPGLNPTIDAVLVLPRGVLVAAGVDLPGPAIRLEAPIDGPWLVDGWRLVCPDGAVNPVGGAIAAASAVAARLRATGAPGLPVHAAIVVGPYVEKVVQPPADLDRGVRVLPPSGRTLLALAMEFANGVRPCGAAAAAELLRVLAPELGTPPPAMLAAEGFQAANRP